MANKIKYNTKPVTFFTEPQWNVSFDPKIIKNFDYKIRCTMGQIIEALKKYGPQIVTNKNLTGFDFKIDTITNNRFHIHIHHNHSTYIANWEKNKSHHSIYLVNLGSHENFDFQKTISFKSC